MAWTRLSFFYLMTYLVLGGVGLLAAPQTAIHYLGSTATYPSVMLRLLGAFMVALGIIVISIVRNRVEVLYRTTLAARSVLLAAFLWAFIDSRDPFFLVIAAIVGLGMILTTTGMIADRA
jgi:uncharacterized protein YjeT (DUF2065 family)